MSDQTLLVELLRQGFKDGLLWVLEEADTGTCQCGCIEDSIMKILKFTSAEERAYEDWGKDWKKWVKYYEDEINDE